MCSSEALTLQWKEQNCFIESSFCTLNQRQDWGEGSWFIKQWSQSLKASVAPTYSEDSGRWGLLTTLWDLTLRILNCCSLADFFKGEEKSSPQLVCSCNLLFELNSCSFSRGGHSCSFILMCALLIFSIWVWSSIHWSQWKDSHWLQCGMEQVLLELFSNIFCYHLKFLYWSFLWKGDDLFMLIADNSCDVCGIQIMGKWGEK